MTDGEGTLRTTLELPTGLNESIESQLNWSDSKAAWIREACRQRLDREK